MFKKIFNKGFIFILALFLVIGAFFILKSDLGAIAYEKFFKGNILIGGKVQVVGVGVRP